MPTDGTWIGGGGTTAYSDVTNWLDGIVASGTGATITWNSGAVPASARPTEWTFHFSVLYLAGAGDIANFLNGAIIGNVNIGAGCSCAIGANVTGTLVVGVGGQATLGGMIVSGAVTNAGTLAGSAQFTSKVTSTGTIASGTWDFNGNLEGDGGTIGSGTAVTITGIVNVTNCTWNVAANSTLHADLAGTQNLGTTLAIANLTLHVTAGAGQTVTLAGAPNVRGFTLNTDGTLAGGGVTLTLGAGAYTSTKGTVTGTLNVALGTGGIYYNDGDYTAATLNVTVVGSCAMAWAGPTAGVFNKLTINANQIATLDDSVSFKSRAGSGTLAMGSNIAYFKPSEAGDWASTGTTTGTVAFRIQQQVTPLVLTNAMNLGALD